MLILVLVVLLRIVDIGGRLYQKSGSGIHWRKSFLAIESGGAGEPDIDRDRDRHKQIHSVAL